MKTLQTQRGSRVSGRLPLLSFTLIGAIAVATFPRASERRVHADPLAEPARFERIYWAQRGMEHGNPLTASRFRVNAPEAVLHPSFGRRDETLSSGMLQIHFPESLFDLAGAELYLELWGGHPGTANKRVTLNGRTTHTLPGVGVEEKHCTHEYPTIPLPLTDLVGSYNAVQFACDQGTTFWGHFIVDGACLRAILRDDHPDLEKAGLQGFEAAVEAEPGEDPETLRLTLAITEPLAEKIAAVDFLGYYDGYDENGSTRTRDWHGFTKDRQPVAILGSADAPPFEIVWDLGMLPEQQEMAVRAVVRFDTPPNLQYRTAATGGLRVSARRDAAVRRFLPDELPRPFWSRANRAVKCSMEVDVDPAQIERAELHVVAWGSGPGTITDYFTLNGHRLPIPAAGHQVHYSRRPIEPRMLREGANEFVLVSDTEHHGIEILRPGPALMIRYRTR